MKNPLRIIPRLEFKGPNLIKGLEFEGNRCLGVLENFVRFYEKQTADEIFLYDIVASLYKQNFNFNQIKNINPKFSVPVTFCGGIKSEEDVNQALNLGADKVSINTAFLKNLNLLKDLVKVFGSPTIISNVEYYFDGNQFLLLGDFGRTVYQYNLYEWVEKLIDNGIGEIHLLNVKSDGYGEFGDGPDSEVINKICSKSKVPIVYGCGIGKREQIIDLNNNTKLSGLSISSLFHYAFVEKIERSFASHFENNLRDGRNIDSGNIEFINSGYGGFDDIFVNPIKINDLKKYMKENNCEIRE